MRDKYIEDNGQASLLENQKSFNYLMRDMYDVKVRPYFNGKQYRVKCFEENDALADKESITCNINQYRTKKEEFSF
ncbi:MAG: hypothetical protein ACTFAL_05535 [Candidatus Electronema sp. V4]|uniref:hypothetical protein n=1 Tax=Candidatus Electronema sp. V4 TaxID=3454756 RepID=UPI0040555905